MIESIAHRKASFKTKTGEEFVLNSLEICDFVSIREESLKDYKRTQIKTYTDNLDLIPEDQRQSLLADAFARAEKIVYEDLPKKLARVAYRDEDGNFVRDAKGGIALKEQEVEYSIWWMSNTPQGMRFALWLSMTKISSQQHMTLKDVDRMFHDAMDDLEAAMELVGKLSETHLGNSSAPARPAKEPMTAS